MHKVLYYTLLIAGVAGCASTHDLTKGNNVLGGGYKQEEKGPGLFYIYARSNHAPWPTLEAARTTWRTGAERACASADYDELAIEENEKDTGLQTSSGVRYLVAERTGYAKCDSSTLSSGEVGKIIGKDSAIR
ncbi:MAG: hypothetical protein KJ798_04645 [Gammaproteobacteria bacterium]|uniref:hypothetical protein n=1 Tax=Limnobacter sp. TaxID=2003368 RepID=UPI001DE67EAB|nr:hypothetical protein [Limnobacter sp.]MBU0782739.1 hypothetical protein [Gammaproteobacteria bacterium]MBU0849327.1 hypothetical protein [Gammaproteobacteria bacterium]MBU1268822.1 hypothetical protein [Gammaproteobacteria bacterium]MBU1527682.1 hypothetical protein [Gammaproteobacteria bacterium]MBU1779653.1 hypothetical protein [Gammaproteobacteria bacterium]